MLTRIIHNSQPLVTFFKSLNMSLSQPQQRHLLNMADALLVYEGTKTLAALQRQFIDAPDPSNMADFLRISPWSAKDVRARLRENQVAWAISQAQDTGAPPVIYINLDDSIGEKDKQTRHIEPVDWFHDHNESPKNKPSYKNGFCYLECSLRIGQVTVTVDLRLYLREKTVRKINRGRPKDQRIAFHSKTALARQMLEMLRPLLPAGWQVIVQFDSWYASKRLIKYVRRQRWHVTCGLKCNRKLNQKRLDNLADALRHRRYRHVRLTATDGNKTTYYVRQAEGRLTDVPFDVRVYFSKRHPRERSQAYFCSTDLTRSTQQVLQGYQARWSCEVVNFYVKTQLGLADFRVQSYQAVDKYIAVVHLAWAYIEQRFETERSREIRCYGDIIRRHRDEHAQNWLTGALEMVLETGDIDSVVQRFLRLSG